MKSSTKVGAGALVGVFGIVSTGAIASADSPTITASGGQCAAKWFKSGDDFGIEDRDVNDNDYCYVQYGFTENSVNNRISRPQDVGGTGYYDVSVGDNKTIYWKLCKERQDDPDICSVVRPDETSKA